MAVQLGKSITLVSAGFLCGLLAANLPGARAEATAPGATDLSQKRFMVSIDEIRRSFVFADHFTGTYRKDVVMSDGTMRRIELTPMVHNGKQVVEFKDTGGLTYIGLNGTTTNGALMVQLRDMDAVEARLAAEGWRTK